MPLPLKTYVDEHEGHDQHNRGEYSLLDCVKGFLRWAELAIGIGS